MEEKKELGMQALTERRGEVAIAAMAAKAKAEVEARYVIALQRPRNIQNARIAILEACKRPKFAEGARYRKPVGGGRTVDGLSIRFAEEALKAMTNIYTDCVVVYEDEDKRIIHVTVTDLETNTTYGDDITIARTVERRELKAGQVAISERTNSTGQKVFLVAATEDDVANKVNAAKSKIIRNNGLRIVPQDILEEAEETIINTLSKGGEDPKAATKKVCDAFAGLGVKPNELERLLGHSLESVSPKELIDLRATYSAIKDGETSWAEVIAQADPKRPVHTGPGEPSAAGTPGEKPKVIEKPLDFVRDLMKADGASESQVMEFMRDPKVNLCKADCPELAAVSDESLRALANTWKNVVAKIKKLEGKLL